MLKTDALPVGTRPLMIYQATVVSFELRTSQSGNPAINVTLQRHGGGKRFDNLNFKSHWFTPEFDQAKITDPTERNLFYMTIGKQGRNGKVLIYLDGQTGNFDTAEQLVQTLNAVSVGKTFWVREKQRIEKGTGIPTERYDLSLSKEPPKRVPEGAIWLTAKPEESAPEASAASV